MVKRSTAAQLGGHLGSQFRRHVGCWLLSRGHPGGGVVSLVTITVEAVFWYGYALPFPPLLGLLRLVLMANGLFALTNRRQDGSTSAPEG